MAIWILFLLTLALQEPLGARIHVHGRFQDLRAPGPEQSPEAREGSGTKHPSCSRSKSRVAHTILEDYLWGFVEQKNYTLPKKCKLHPDDMYRAQEERKVDMRYDEWRCAYCNKIFRGEIFIDQHMDNRHSDRLDPSNGHCLASVCDVVHCDWYRKERMGVAAGKKGKKVKCKADVAERRRKACQTVAQNCFPLGGGPVARSLHDFFLQQFCDAHTCAINVKMFPLGLRRRREIHVFWYLLCVLLFLAGLGFYVIVYIHIRDAKGKTGLQRARKQQWSWPFGVSKKTGGKQN